MSLASFHDDSKCAGSNIFVKSLRLKYGLESLSASLNTPSKSDDFWHTSNPLSIFYTHAAAVILQ